MIFGSKNSALPADQGDEADIVEIVNEVDGTVSVLRPGSAEPEIRPVGADDIAGFTLDDLRAATE